MALDPKGVLGERKYEVGALLRNPDLDRFSRQELKRMQARQVAILAEVRQDLLTCGVLLGEIR
ncbi:MAG: hypothetical protein MUO62_17850, partial [Anaerolineales bacterium]|nr:hypothetical protein [Anaerolineales bacterium]